MNAMVIRCFYWIADDFGLVSDSFKVSLCSKRFFEGFYQHFHNAPNRSCFFARFCGRYERELQWR